MTGYGRRQNWCTMAAGRAGGGRGGGTGGGGRGGKRWR